MKRMKHAFLPLLIAVAVMAVTIKLTQPPEKQPPPDELMETDRTVQITWGSFAPPDEPPTFTATPVLVFPSLIDTVRWRYLTGYWRYFDTDRHRTITWGGEA